MGMDNFQTLVIVMTGLLVLGIFILAFLRFWGRKNYCGECQHREWNFGYGDGIPTMRCREYHTILEESDFWGYRKCRECRGKQKP
jgi:hypothetical protein